MWRSVLFLSMFACAGHARADFTDEFSGPSLHPRWDFFSEGSGWDWHFEPGGFVVDRVFGPFEVDEVGVTARVTPRGSYVASSRVYWSGAPMQRVDFGVSAAYPFMNPRLASFRYGDGVVLAFVQDGGTASKVVGPGWHTWSIQFTGTNFVLSLDGAVLLRASVLERTSPGYVFLGVAGNESNFGQVKFDKASFRKMVEKK